MNLPNILTLSRLGWAVVLIFLLTLTFPFSKSLALLVFVVASLTDFLDGYLARNVHGVTSFGKLMDPLADKVLVCAAFVTFVELQLVPAWVAVIIISREFLVTGLRLLAVSKGEIISAGQWGKHKTVWQIIAILVILLGLAVRYDWLAGADTELLASYDTALQVIALAVSCAAVLITVASGGMYFYQHRNLVERSI